MITIEQFLECVLPDSGTLIVATLNPKGGMKHTFVTSVDKAAQVLRKHDAVGRNTFIAMASFNGAKNRTQDNVAYRCTFSLDIDCGPGEGKYATKANAQAAFVQWTGKTGMCPPTAILDTGNGYHVQYVVDTMLPPQEWQPLANRLKDLCEEHGLLADPAVTADIARVLRAPDTHNYKDPANVKDVQVVFPHGDELTKIPVDKFRTALKAVPKLQLVQSEASEFDIPDTRPAGFKAYAKYMIPQCLVMHYALDTGGRDFGEPPWWLQLHLLAYCEDGYEYIHQVSNQHKDYSPEKTEAKFKERLEVRAKSEDGTGRRIGPPTCAALERYHSDACRLCPHHGKITSPIVLGKPPPEKMPAPWEQREHGVYKVIEDEALLVLPFRIELFEVQRFGEEYFVLAVVAMGTHTVEILLPLSILSDTAINFGKKLGATAPLPLQPEQIKELFKLMTTWAQQLLKAGKRVSGANSFGWTRQGDIYGFTVNTHTYWSNGTETLAATSSAGTPALYKPTGDIEVWKKAAALILQNNHPALHLGLASAFASPLIPFTGVSGAVMSLVSAESGTGKTTVLRTAQAVWAAPKKSLFALDDTPTAVVYKLGLLKNLPAYWDEIRSHNVVEFVKMLFRLGQGKGKSRMTRDIQMRETGEWDTLIVCATNEHIKDYLARYVQGTDAGVLRLFEVECDNGRKRSVDSEALQIFYSLDENYGQAGDIYAQHLAKNRDKIKLMVEKLQQMLYTKLEADHTERFRIATMAALLAGATLAKELGLVDFNLPQLADTMIDEFRIMREAQDEYTSGTKNNVMERVEEYVQQFRGSFILYPDEVLTATGATTQEIGEQAMAANTAKDFGPIRGWLTPSYIILDRTQFREWLFKERQVIGWTTFKRELEKGADVNVHRFALERDALNGDPSLRPRCLVIPRTD